MRTYARNGITIDQCTVCHGIFLDRGELERLITAESSYLGGSPPEGRPAGDRGFLGELFD
jgi:Zn-finger nucleic acid-binding protein